MIFAKISDTTSFNITAFECGTRAEFDIRHPGDPLWVFVDSPNAEARSDITDFLLNPTTYYIDKNNNFRKR